MTAGARALTYAVAGLVGEMGFTGIRGRPSTSAWMLPVYALAVPLFEPFHDRLRGHSRWHRACAYAVGFSVVEYMSGRSLRCVRGAAPWDYSHARLQIDGLLRADYLPVWAAAGFVFERLHDTLVLPGS